LAPGLIEAAGINTIESKLIDELQYDGFSFVVIACYGQGDPPRCAFGLPQLHQVSSINIVESLDNGPVQLSRNPSALRYTGLDRIDTAIALARVIVAGVHDHYIIGRCCEQIARQLCKSAYTGKNISEGQLGEFIKRIRAKQMPKGSILIVESPDRVSRQPFSEAWPTYQLILNAGVEVHFISIHEVLRPGEHTFADILRIGIEIDRANFESKTKSDRCGAAWAKKRGNADGQAAMTARVPNWLKAEKGKPIRIIPERARFVK